MEKKTQHMLIEIIRRPEFLASITLLWFAGCVGGGEKQVV